jgi:ribosomal-protein-alanine N-acetyltransferase
MLPRDLPEVLAIEQATFPIPWTHESFLHEIERNPFACNRVVRSRQGAVVGYASAWMVDGEVRINNIAIREANRGQGCGEALLRNLLALGKALGCTAATLEVRPSNSPAISLYSKLGFREAGRRKEYYTDTREDALVMKVFL